MRHDVRSLLFRLAYLAVTSAFAVLRLLLLGDRDKDVEILALRHQITVLERQLGADASVGFAPEDRALLAALLASLPREVLRRVRLLVRPDTVLRWLRDLLKQPSCPLLSREAARAPANGPLHPRSHPAIGQSWGYRRVHGELATLGIKGRHRARHPARPRARHPSLTRAQTGLPRR
ncbi:hypothetical protein [Nonomuraea angiospora]